MTKLSTKNKTIERRTEERQFCSAEILFATKNQLYEGRLENWSRRGLFIRTTGDFRVGEVITVAVPYIEGADHKRYAQIVWRNKRGVGVELFRAHQQSDPAAIRLETKFNYYQLKAETVN